MIQPRSLYTSLWRTPNPTPLLEGAGASFRQGCGQRAENPGTPQPIFITDDAQLQARQSDICRL